MGVNNLPRVVTQQRPVEDRTRDLLIASPTPYLFATTLSLECCIMMFISFYIARPTYCFILMYTCRLTFAIKRIGPTLCYVYVTTPPDRPDSTSEQPVSFWGQILGDPYRGFAPRPRWGTSVPRPSTMHPLSPPPQKNLKLKLRLC